MVFLYGGLHIIWKPKNVQIREHSLFYLLNNFYWGIKNSVFIDINWRLLVFKSTSFYISELQVWFNQFRQYFVYVEYLPISKFIRFKMIRRKF